MLLELVLVATMLAVILAAILTIADGTSRTAAADQERTNTIGNAQVGIARIADDLRNACIFFGAGGAGAPNNYYCSQLFTSAPTASLCTRSSDCVDFIANARSSGASPRPLTRIRIDCGTTDGSVATRTQCSRYAVSCTPSSCPSPTSLTGVVVRGVTNGGATGSPTNVFVYCDRTLLALSGGTAACNATPATADAIQISLAVARQGQRRIGVPGSFLLQEAAGLNNINEDPS
jgi:type II secretory pathway pseudopilin PulG